MDRKTENALIDEVLNLKKAGALYTKDDLHQSAVTDYVCADRLS